MPKGDNLYYAKSNLINSDYSKITQFLSIQVSPFAIFKKILLHGPLHEKTCFCM